MYEMYNITWLAAAIHSSPYIYPSLNELLYIATSGFTKNSVMSLKIHAGILSGPGDLSRLILLNYFQLHQHLSATQTIAKKALSSHGHALRTRKKVCLQTHLCTKNVYFACVTAIFNLDSW